MLRSMKLKSLNPHISCVLCGGYLVDATTIIECLHSFCKSCIIRWLQKSYHCPVCETEVHKTRPFLNIRPDRVLQDIVYKLVPGFYHNELQRRKDFEKAINEDEDEQENGSNESEMDEKKGVELIEDPVCIALEYYGSKRNWKEKTAEVVRSDEILSDHLTMSEISRIYGLHTKSFIDLQYVFISKNDTKSLEHHNQKDSKQQMNHYRNAFYHGKNQITKKESLKKEIRKNEIQRKEEDANMKEIAAQNVKIFSDEKVDQYDCPVTPESDDHDSMVAAELPLESTQNPQLQAY